MMVIHMWILNLMFMTSIIYHPEVYATLNDKTVKSSEHNSETSLNQDRFYWIPGIPSMRIRRQADHVVKTRTTNPYQSSRENGGRLIYSGVAASGPQVQSSAEWEQTDSPFDSKVKEIFILGDASLNTEQKPVVFNQNDKQLLDDNGPQFVVQRSPDGKLVAVVHSSDNNKTSVTPHHETMLAPSNITTESPIVRGTRDIITNKDNSHPLPSTGIQKPSCAEPGQVFCNTVEDYPAQLVESVLKEVPKYEQLFGDDLVTLSVNITQRIDVPGEESLCDSTERLIYPQLGFTKDNSWNYIINQPNYTQGLRIEECISTGKPCKMTESLQNGYTTECRQKYIYRQLLSINTEGVVVKDLFRLPSCCKCILISTGNSRFKRQTPVRRKYDDIDINDDDDDDDF